jgi:hypothetical protein
MMRQTPYQNTLFREKAFANCFRAPRAARRNNPQKASHCSQEETGEIQQQRRIEPCVQINIRAHQDQTLAGTQTNDVGSFFRDLSA